MNKNKKLYIGFSFFLVIISGLLLFCIFLVFKDNNNVNDDLITTYLKYNGENVDEIVIDKIDSNINSYDFSVIGFAANKNVYYDIILDNPNKKVINVTLLEINHNNEDNNLDSASLKKVIEPEIVLYNDKILSGEVAYGKNFRLLILTNKKMESSSDIKLKLVLKDN